MSANWATGICSIQECHRILADLIEESYREGSHPEGEALMADEVALILSKANNIIHEIPVGSAAYKRCKANPKEYEDVTKLKQEAAKAEIEKPKKPEKSG